MNRYLGALFLGVCLSVTALTGCGDDSAEDGDDGDDGGGSQKAELNQQSAAVVGSQSAAAVRQLGKGDGQSAAGSLFGVASVAAAIAVPSGGAQQQQSVDVGELGVAAAADCETECHAEGDSGSCDFTDCDTGSFSIAGHMEWTATHFACDVTYGIAAASEGQNVTLDYHLVAAIDYTATSIDGTLSMDGDFSSAGQTSSYDVDVTYNHLEFPAESGCPTSGSISVSAVIDAGAAHYEASGDVVFPVEGCTG